MTYNAAVGKDLISPVILTAASLWIYLKSALDFSALTLPFFHTLKILIRARNCLTYVVIAAV